MAVCDACVRTSHRGFGSNSNLAQANSDQPGGQSGTSAKRHRAVFQSVELSVEVRSLLKLFVVCARFARSRGVAQDNTCRGTHAKTHADQQRCILSEPIIYRKNDVFR